MEEISLYVASIIQQDLIRMYFTHNNHIQGRQIVFVGSYWLLTGSN
jgi:hypothetical protein